VKTRDGRDLAAVVEDLERRVAELEQERDEAKCPSVEDEHREFMARVRNRRTS